MVRDHQRDVEYGTQCRMSTDQRQLKGTTIPIVKIATSRITVSTGDTRETRRARPRSRTTPPRREMKVKDIFLRVSHCVIEYHNRVLQGDLF